MFLDDIPPLSSADLEALDAAPMDDGLLPLELLDPRPAPWLEAISEGSDFPLPGASLTGFDETSDPAFSSDTFWDALLAPAPELVPVPGVAADSPILLPIITMSTSGGACGAQDSTSGSAAGGGANSSGCAPAGGDARRKGHKGRGGGGRKQLSEEQRERIRAKNRRAQNRYREKQKVKMAAAENEYVDTAAELDRARLENLRLREQQTTMQQVLSVRDSAMAILQTGKVANDAEVQGLPCGCLSHDKCSCPKAVTPGGSVAKVLAGLGPHARLPDSSAQRTGEQAACPLTGLSLSQIGEVKETPPDVLQQSWKGIVQRLEVILQQLSAAQGVADANLSQRMEQLEAVLHDTLLEGQFFFFEHAVHKPANVQKLFAAVLDDGPSQISIEDVRHWKQVASALQLTSEQVEQLAAARSRFLASIGEVCSERRALLDRLATVQVPTTLKGLQHVTAPWLELHEATAGLSANMAREHRACMAFVRDAFAYVLTPQQKAVAAVRSFPFFPDMYIVSTLALQAAGHPASCSGQ